MHEEALYRIVDDARDYEDLARRAEEARAFLRRVAAGGRRHAGEAERLLAQRVAE